MRMKKLIYTIVTVVVAIVLSAGYSANKSEASEYTQNVSDAELMSVYTSTDGYWNYDFVDESKGTIEITGYNGSDSGFDAALVVPSTIDGYKVTRIGDYAFAFCSDITDIKISDSVTSIGEWAFYYCTSLKKVTIGKNVTSIGNCAFILCTALKTLTIGKNVKTIGGSAFYGCKKLTKVTIPSKVTSIGTCAFMDCTALKTVVIGKSVKKIEKKAFYNCKKLSKITIKSKKLKTSNVGAKAFSKIKSTVKIKVPKSKKSAYKKMLLKKGVSKKAKISA